MLTLKKNISPNISFAASKKLKPDRFTSIDYCARTVMTYTCTHSCCDSLRTADDEGEESQTPTAAERCPAGPAQGQPVLHPALRARQSSRERVDGFSQERPRKQQ